MSGNEDLEDVEEGTQWGVLLSLVGVGVAAIGILFLCICRGSTRDSSNFNVVNHLCILYKILLSYLRIPESSASCPPLTNVGLAQQAV